MHIIYRALLCIPKKKIYMEINLYENKLLHIQILTLTQSDQCPCFFEILPSALASVGDTDFSFFVI